MLSEVELGENLMQIGGLAFNETKLWNDSEELVYADDWLVGCKNTSITKITLREDTVGIGDYVFYGCQSFTALALPDSVRAVGNYAFCLSKSLMNAVLGNGVERIGDYAFFGCEILQVLMVGDNLVSIGAYAFDGCTRLSNISLPDSVESIGTWAFHNTSLWNNANGVVYVGDWVVGCTNPLIGSVAVRAGTVGIAAYSFYGCIGLVDIFLPDSIETIGRGAFYGCGLSSVQLPAGLKVLGDYAFYQCASLEKWNFPKELKGSAARRFMNAQNCLLSPSRPVCDPSAGMHFTDVLR